MKIVFFGTSIFAVPILEKLTAHYKVVLVVTTPDAKVGRRQKLEASPVSISAANLNLVIEKPRSLKNPGIFQILADLNADLYIVVAYGKIIPENILALPKLGCLNVHGSLLPAYRGPAPIQFALWQGEKQTGNTIMVMDEQIDHGPILAQDSVIINPKDCFKELEQKMSQTASQTLLQTVSDYKVGKISPQPQDHSQATFTRIINKSDGKIDWQETASQTYNRYRALNSWPGLWTIYKNQKIKINKCSVSEKTTTENPATITSDGLIACAKGTMLKIEQLQPEGKKEMSWKEFLNGRRDILGTNFN